MNRRNLLRSVARSVLVMVAAIYAPCTVFQVTDRQKRMTLLEAAKEVCANRERSQEAVEEILKGDK